MSKLMAVTFIFLLASVARPLFAEDRDLRYQLSLEELLNIEISTVSKQTESFRDAPASVYVITEQDIIFNGYQRLSDVLNSVPGFNPINLDFFTFGGVRGLLGNFSQTLILLNGREVQNLIAAETFISEQFATNNIELIEIINGPGSALYGANALLGIINIKTKVASKTNVPNSLMVDLGSEDKHGVSAFAQTQQANWSASVFARFQKTGYWEHSEFVQDTEKFSDGSPQILQVSHNIGHTGYENESTVKSLSAQINYKNWFLGFEGYRLENGKGLENVALNYSDQFDVRKFRLLYAGTEIELNRYSKLKFDIKSYKEWFWGRNYLYNQSTFDQLVQQGRATQIPITPQEVTSHFTDIYSQEKSKGSSRIKVDLLFEKNNFYQGSITTGYSYDEQDILGVALSNIDEIPDFNETIANDNPHRRPFYKTSEHSLFVQFKHPLFHQDVQLTLAGRLDDHSIYGVTNTIRSGLVYHYDTDLTYKILFGQAFREPNIFEQGAHVPPEIPANLDLKPAEIDTWEFSLNHNYQYAISTQLVWFHNKVKNLIEPVSTLQFDNSTQDIDVYGVEAWVRFQADKYSGDLAYTWLAPDDTDVNNKMEKRVNVPEHKLSLGINYEVSPNLRVNSRANWIDKINAEHGNPNIESAFPINSAFVLDVNFHYDLFSLIGQSSSISLNMKNALNKSWYQPNVRNGGPKQFLQPGRQWQIRYELHF